MPGSSSISNSKMRLSQVRDKPEEIYEKLHALLMERADLIEHIVVAKAEQGSVHAVLRPLMKQILCGGWFRTIAVFCLLYHWNLFGLRESLR